MTDDLICSICGKSAQVNTPCIDEQGNIICYRCREELNDGKLRRGIKHHRDRDGALSTDDSIYFFYNKALVSFYRNRHCENMGPQRVILDEPMYSISAYTDHGHTSFPLTKDEKLEAIASPKAVLLLIDMYDRNGWFRCTTCGEKFNEEDVAGYPLFSGKVCKHCWKLHLEYLEDERKKGHVCSMCRQPYGNCCC